MAEHACYRMKIGASTVDVDPEMAVIDCLISAYYVAAYQCDLTSLAVPVNRIILIDQSLFFTLKVGKVFHL